MVPDWQEALEEFEKAVQAAAGGSAGADLRWGAGSVGAVLGRSWHWSKCWQKEKKDLRGVSGGAQVGKVMECEECLDTGYLSR